jgi:hypothetical protein
LRAILFNSSAIVNNPPWNLQPARTHLNSLNPFLEVFQKAIAMNSVACELNPHPPAPVQFLPAGEVLTHIQVFQDKTSGYYATMASTGRVGYTKDVLK